MCSSPARKRSECNYPECRYINHLMLTGLAKLARFGFTEVRRGSKRVCSLNDRWLIKMDFLVPLIRINCELIDSTSFTYADMWSPSHEAICARNSDLLRLIIQYRDYQRALQTSSAMKRLLTLLKVCFTFNVK